MGCGCLSFRGWRSGRAASDGRRLPRLAQPRVVWAPRSPRTHTHVRTSSRDCQRSRDTLGGGAKPCGEDGAVTRASLRSCSAGGNRTGHRWPWPWRDRGAGVTITEPPAQSCPRKGQSGPRRTRDAPQGPLFVTRRLARGPDFRRRLRSVSVARKARKRYFRSWLGRAPHCLLSSRFYPRQPGDTPPAGQVSASFHGSEVSGVRPKPPVRR